MDCPTCHRVTHVVDSRREGDKVFRRRGCKLCGTKFNTVETFLADAGHGEHEKPRGPRPKMADSIILAEISRSIGDVPKGRGW